MPNLISQRISIAPLAVELASKGLILCLGMFFSPSWLMLENALKPFVDIKAVLHSSNTLVAYAAMIQQIRALDPQVILGSLIPSLLLCMLTSILFMTAMIKLANVFSKHAVSRLCSGNS
jgi:hypothetical protein